MKSLIKSLLMLMVCTVSAQQHSLEGAIAPVKIEGLHKILIPHGVRSHLRQDIRDFRIWDAQENQVPYFIQQPQELTLRSDFTEFIQISQSKTRDTSSTYIFKNPHNTLSELVLSIANYQGNKTFSLEGSNDQEQWFGIVNKNQLNALSSTTKTRILKAIQFPLCSYQYLKIVFNDRNSLPINLLKLGTATTELIHMALEEIPVRSTEFVEIGKKTQIHIRFTQREIIDQVTIEIRAPNLYNRQARLYTLKEKEVKQTKETYQQNLAHFNLHSDKTTAINILAFFEAEIFMEIENQDSPPLKIDALHFLQRPLYVVASLDPKKKYTITAGDQTLTTPNYDISDFKNRVSEDLPLAQILSVTQHAPVAKEKTNLSFWQQPWFMWGCIGLATVMIVFFSFHLLKELKQGEGQS